MRQLLMISLLLACNTLYGQFFTPTQDSYVNSQSPTTSYGSSTSAPIQVVSGPYYTRTFVQFDLSSIPFGAIISSARLTLTSNGAEGTDIGTTGLVLESVTGAWNGDTITGSHPPLVTTVNAVSTSSATVPGKRVFDVKTLVSSIVDHRSTNYGWRIRRNNETAATVANSYFTKEGTTPPSLAIVYYMPYEISSAVITHATELTSTDGSISPQIINGPGGTPTYTWYDKNGTVKGTTQNLYNVSYGWYGLKVSTTAHTLYYAFVVGVENQAVNITFKVSPDYSQESMVYNRVSGGLDYSNGNYDNYPTYQTQDWGVTGDWYTSRFLVKYNLWIDPAMTVNQSDLYLKGDNHYSALRPNTAEFRKITQPWQEKIATFNNAPATTTSISKTVPGTSTATQNSTIDLKDFWNDWKTSNTTNYGMDFRLSLYSTVRARQQYHSSNAADTSLRPVIQFNVELPYAETPLTLGYARLKDQFDGGYTKTAAGKLKIYFSEDYLIAPHKYLPLRIYDETHLLKGSVDLNGNIAGASGTPQLEYHFDDNRHIVNLSALSLTDNKIYILEVRTSTGEKKYLKFLYKN